MARDFEKSEQMGNEFGILGAFAESARVHVRSLKRLLSCQDALSSASACLALALISPQATEFGAIANTLKAWGIAFHFLNHADESLFFVTSVVSYTN